MKHTEKNDLAILLESESYSQELHKCKNLTWGHDLTTKSNQHVELWIKHATIFFQHLLLTKSIYFGLNKTSWTIKDLPTCIQLMGLEILQRDTHAIMGLLHKFHNFSTCKTADIK